MTISVNIADVQSVETYAGLQTFITDHLELDAETVSALPNLIRLAENTLNRRLTTPWRDTSTLLETVAGQQNLSLPLYFQQATGLFLNGGHPLEPVSLNTLYGEYSCTGAPRAFCISEQELWIGPVPDAPYTLRLTYQSRLAPLSDANPTNWLLADHADAYVYGCLSQCEAFLGNKEGAAFWASALEPVIDEINTAGNRYRLSKPIRLRNPVVV